jgi:small nuclear ribonucleoprotein (snRNP)-like protein
MTEQPPRLHKKPTPPPPATKPVTAPTLHPAKLHVLARFVGGRIVVQQVSGVMIEGQLTALDEGVHALTMTNCRIIGTKRTAEVEHLVVFIRKTVAYVHTVPTTLTDLRPTETAL